MSQIIDFLIEKANGLPLSPGVYIMRDESGKVIYVGKSRVLKNRVSQYFKETGHHDFKTAKMVSNAREDLPEPDTPVITMSLSRGMVRSIFFKLCSRAPFITILSFANFFCPFNYLKHNNRRIPCRHDPLFFLHKA